MAKRMGAKDRLRFIDVLRANAGNIKKSCEAFGIARRQYYYWMEKDADFASAVEDVSEGIIDYAESKLLQQIKDGNTTAIIFFLKCRAKKRGYIERQEHELTGANGAPLAFDVTVNIVRPPER